MSQWVSNTKWDTSNFTISNFHINTTLTKVEYTLSILQIY